MAIIKIGSKTCGPCMMAEKKLNSMGVEYTSLDAYDDDVIEKYNIRNIPTIIKTDTNGDEIMRLVGGECLNNDILKGLL